MFTFKKDKSVTPVSDERFHPSNKDKLTAAELLAAINKQKKAAPATSVLVSMRDIFGDEGNYSPSLYSVTSIVVDGRTMSLKIILRGISNSVTAKTTDEAQALAAYFAYVAKSLKKAAPSIDKVRDENIRIKLNNEAIEDLKALYEVQRRHEVTLSHRDLAAIEHKESQERRITDLEAIIAELTADKATSNEITTEEGK